MPATYYRGISCILGFLACYSYLPLIKHLSLRLVLWQSGTIPWNYARFLNYCTERLLLQRIGGAIASCTSCCNTTLPRWIWSEGIGSLYLASLKESRQHNIHLSSEITPQFSPARIINIRTTTAI
jgi:hypothetical protein